MTDNRWHRPLTGMALLMTALAVFCLAAMPFDDRQVLGESVWLKPLKFAIAFAVYGVTLAWLLRFPHRGRRWTGAMGTIFAIAGTVDVGFIAVQAARGTFSHFNTSDDPVNRYGQMIFTSGVPGLFLSSLVLAVIVLWQRLGDRPTSTALRFGMVSAVAGMALAYSMGFAGDPQTVTDADGTVVDLAARHSVGADDGGPGLPIVHWSTVGGDVRVPHFVGMHGFQAMILVAAGLGMLAARVAWLRAERTRAALVAWFGLGYLGTVAALTWQAWRGQSLVHPDAATLTVFAALWAAVAAAAAVTLLSAAARPRELATPARHTARAVRRLPRLRVPQ